MFGVINFFKNIINWSDKDPSHPDPSGRSWLTEISAEIRLNILQFLQPQALCRSAQTCKTLNETVYPSSPSVPLLPFQKQLAVAKTQAQFNQEKKEAFENPFCHSLCKLSKIMEKEIEQDLFEGAIETAKLAYIKGDDGKSLIQLVEIEAKRGLYDQSKLAIEKFFGSCVDAKDLAYQNIALIEKEKMLFDQAKATAKQIVDLNARDQMMSLIAIEEARRCLCEQAKMTVAQFSNQTFELKDSTYKYIAEIETFQGLFDQARETAGQIQAVDIRNQVMSTIAKAESYLSNNIFQ